MRREFVKFHHTLHLRPNAPATVSFKTATPGCLRKLEVALLWADPDAQRVGLSMSDHDLPYECEVRHDDGDARAPKYRQGRVLVELDFSKGGKYVASSDAIDGHGFTINSHEGAPPRFVDDGVVLDVLEFGTVNLE